MPPLFEKHPVPIKEFFAHLDNFGKTQYNMASHKLQRNDIGQVTGIVSDDVTCLPLPTSAPTKKKLTLENVAGFIDIEVVKKSKLLAAYHSLVCSAGATSCILT